MTEKEEQFMQYWAANREREKKWQHQLLVGIPIGLLFSLPIVVIQITGKYWYVRADMVANTMLNPYLLVSAIFIIAVFVAVFYKRFQWDQREQHYRELKAKAERESRSGNTVQQ